MEPQYTPGNPISQAVNVTVPGGGMAPLGSLPPLQFDNRNGYQFYIEVGADLQADLPTPGTPYPTGGLQGGQQTTPPSFLVNLTDIKRRLMFDPSRNFSVYRVALESAFVQANPDLKTDPSGNNPNRFYTPEPVYVVSPQLTNQNGSRYFIRMNSGLTEAISQSAFSTFFYDLPDTIEFSFPCILDVLPDLIQPFYANSPRIAGSRDIITGLPLAPPYYTNQFITKFNLRFSVSVDTSINIKTLYANVIPQATVEQAIADMAGEGGGSGGGPPTQQGPAPPQGSLGAHHPGPALVSDPTSLRQSSNEVGDAALRSIANMVAYREAAEAIRSRDPTTAERVSRAVSSALSWLNNPTRIQTLVAGLGIARNVLTSLTTGSGTRLSNQMFPELSGGRMLGHGPSDEEILQMAIQGHSIPAAEGSGVEFAGGPPPEVHDLEAGLTRVTMPLLRLDGLINEDLRRAGVEVPPPSSYTSSMSYDPRSSFDVNDQSDLDFIASLNDYAEAYASANDSLAEDIRIHNVARYQDPFSAPEVASERTVTTQVRPRPVQEGLLATEGSSESGRTVIRPSHGDSALVEEAVEQGIQPVSAILATAGEEARARGGAMAAVPEAVPFEPLSFRSGPLTSGMSTTDPEVTTLIREGVRTDRGRPSKMTLDAEAQAKSDRAMYEQIKREQGIGEAKKFKAAVKLNALERSIAKQRKRLELPSRASGTTPRYRQPIIDRGQGAGAAIDLFPPPLPPTSVTPPTAKKKGGKKK